MTDKEQYFPALTGFRAIAAWLVFVYHYNPFDINSLPFLNRLVDGFAIGVSMFFVLSGFLITIRYDHAPVSFTNYIRNRFARIYPLYFILTVLTFIVAGGSALEYVTNLTITKGFSDELKFTGIAQGWSLTVEETFYLLAPLIFLAINRFKVMLWLWPVISLMIGFMLYGDVEFMLTYTFFGRSFEFFVGITLARMYQHAPSLITNHKSIITWFGVAALCICLFIHVPFVSKLLVPLATSLLLWGLITEDSWIKRFLSINIMQMSGKTSYAFYLVHIGVIATWLSASISSNAVILFFLLNVVAITLYYAVERPFNKLLHS